MIPSTDAHDGGYFIVEKNDNMYHYLVSQIDGLDFEVEFSQNNPDGTIENARELWFDLSSHEIYPEQYLVVQIQVQA